MTQRIGHRNLSNANPARGHKDVRRWSTGHIVVTTRYSNQQGFKIATKPLPDQVQPPENIENVLALSRRCLLCIRTGVSTVVTVWSVNIASISESELSELQVKLHMVEDCLMCCASTKQSDQKKWFHTFFWLSERHKNKISYATLYKQWYQTNRFIKPHYFISNVTSIDSDCLSPTHGQRSL